MRKKLDEGEIKTLQGIFVKSGAIDFGKQLIKKYATQAETILQTIDFKNEKSKLGIQALITKISDLKI
jgi:geranylgeranyl pyrophosphate synthase